MAACMKCGVKPQPKPQPVQKAVLKSSSSGGLVKVGAMTKLSVSSPNYAEMVLNPGQLVIMPRSQADELKKEGYPIWIAS